MIRKRLISIDPIKDLVRNKIIDKYNTTTFMNTDVVDVRVDIKEILEQHIAEKQLVEPKIYITTEAYIKMRKLVDDTTTEIGWYGTVTKMPALEEVYIIEDILVYPQKVTGVTCEQDDDKLFEFEMSLTTDQVNHKRFHGHSHVNMTVGPSGVDENFYQDLLSQVNDYFIITITNKRNDYTVRFYDIVNNILYSDLPIRVLLNDGTTIDDWYATAKAQLSNKETVFKQQTYGQTKPYTAADQAKHYKRTYPNPYDEDDEDTMLWDDRLGYISKADKLFYDSIPTKELPTKNKRGRKKKGK